MSIEDVMAIALSYFLGGICTGYYLVRIRKGIDIRDQGSGGVGARNVGRVLGRGGFSITLLGDALKGAAPILLSHSLGFQEPLTAYLLVSVVIGHVWPLLLQFRGGRGVATAFGGILALDWFLGAALVGTTILLLIFRRGVVLSGLAAFLLLPLIAAGNQSPGELILSLVCVAAVVVVAHRHHLGGDAPRGGQ